ncbi:MAG: hypothetical protein H7Z43_06105 [Clostridia bacterium]|nr:hypothetical protein [Deltaproteobacteria bacterium]
MTILFVLAYSFGVPADPVALAQEVVQLVAAGKWSEAAEVTRALDLAIAAKAPLRVTDAHLLKELPEGLGVYTAIQDDTVRGEEAIFYAEVHEHALKKNGSRYELYLVSDFTIIDALGKQLAKDENFGESRFTATTPHRDTFVTATLRTVGLPAGRYSVQWTIRDRIGEKAATTTIPFMIKSSLRP